MKMKIVEKLNKWIAGITALSMVLVFLPQAANASVVVAPVATPGTGIYGSAQSVSLGASLETSICTYYKIGAGVWTRYTGTAIPIDAANGVSVTLQAGSFVPATDCGSTSDIGGKVTMTPQVYTFDKVGPSVGITSPADGSLVSGIVDIRGTVTDTNPSTYSVGVYDSSNVLLFGTGDLPQVSSFTDQGLPIVWNADVATEGQYTIKLNGTDKASNVGNDSVTVYVDRTAPNVPTLLSPANDVAVNNLVVPLDLSWGAVTDLNGPVQYQVRSSVSSHVDINGALDVSPDTSAWQTTTSFTSAFTEGIYYWQVRAEDRFDNISGWSEPWKITVDNTNPIVAPMADILTNVPVNLSYSVTDPVSNLVASGVAAYKWEQVSGPGNMIFNVPGDPGTLASADTDGTYTIRLTAWDLAGNSDSEEIQFTWDTTISPVTDLYSITGDGVVDLHWVNPTDSDFNGVIIYRSTVLGELGTEIATLDKTKSNYVDINVLNGVTYYYTVVATDLLGNQNATAQLVITPIPSVGGTVLTPVSSTLLPTGGPEDSGIQESTQSQGEVKAGESDKNEDQKKDEDKNQNNLPAFGIAILVILGLVGLYLLYLQNPESFSWLLFWKKKK